MTNSIIDFSKEVIKNPENILTEVREFIYNYERNHPGRPNKICMTHEQIGILNEYCNAYLGYDAAEKPSSIYRLKIITELPKPKRTSKVYIPNR